MVRPVVVDVCWVWWKKRQIVGLQKFLQQQLTATGTRSLFLFGSNPSAHRRRNQNSTGFSEGGFESIRSAIRESGEFILRDW